MKEKKVYFKVHSTGNEFGNRYVIAICDKDLIGKTIENKKFKLVISERFYKGEEMDANKVVAILKEAANVNIVGKLSIELALKAGIITKDKIVKIKGVPHAQSTAF